MKEAKFGKALNLVVAKAGKRTSNVTRPEIIVLPAINRFSINSLASDLMQIENGQKVTLLVNPDAESFNEKFYITKGFGDDMATVASVNKAGGFGRTLTFNYSGVYSQMLQGSVDAKETSAEGLAELGLAEQRTTEGGKLAHSALKKVHFEVVSAGEQEIGDETQEVYALTNAKFIDYDPRNVGEGDESAEDEGYDSSATAPEDDE